ncbi:MAG: peptidoglycan bridge formation glycyltransferase FemA/FemB family protein, partial [Clostridiales bacterium]|nr:peptidoglycan bridge formation glycyltransferase FemA/FemB family protein [Clostridiales bacterium]
AQIARSLGYKIRATKNFEGIQPRYVFRLDVENKTEDEIFASFHSKTRYNIRVAKKNGVRIDIGSAADLPRFHEIMRETGARDNFVIRPLSYFQDMARHLGEHMRLYTAHWNDEIIAGTIAIHFGDKVWYLYGASSNSARNVMPNYLLQWEMIRWAIAEKCRIYDFRGVSGIVDESHPLYGLYRFKKGYGGQFTEFIGEMQLTFKPFIAFCVDKLLPIFMALRKKVMVKR